MRVIIAKCEELMRPSVLPGVMQIKDDNADEDWYISNEYWIFCENKGTNLCRNILVSCMYINS